MQTTDKVRRRTRIKYKIRKRVKGTSERPRLVVFRSSKNIYAQLIDDVNSKTLFTVNPKAKDIQEKAGSLKGKIELSKVVGQITAEKAAQLNIKSVVFDRNGYLYHGRVKALADGAREGGLSF